MQQSLLIFDDEINTERWQVPTELPALTGVTRLAMDTETTGKNPFKDKVVGISIAWRDDSRIKKLYAPVAHSEGNMDHDLVRRWLECVLPEKEVGFANAKYDIQILLNGFDLDLEALGVKPRDVAFPDALLDDNRRAGRSLEALGQRYIGKGKLEFDGDKSSMAQYPSWKAGAYAEADAERALEIDEACEPLIKKQGLDKVLELENSIIYAVCEIERNGCRLDVEKLERWRKEVRAEYEKTIMQLHKQTGMLVQVGSGEHMLRLFRHLGIAAPVRVKRKKQGQTQEEFEAEQEDTGKKEVQGAFEVEELLAMKHPVIDLVVKARWWDSLLSKFLDKYHDGLDGEIIRAQYHQLKGDDGGTVRGRFSSSGGGDLRSGYGFNSQQVIKTSLQRETTGDQFIVRELFIPDDGMAYFSADASQIEYRLAAHFANAEKLIKAYGDDPNTDYHKFMMSAIQKIKPTFNDRTVAKGVNFGFVYGAAAVTTARTAGIKVKEAEEILAICKKLFPEAPRLIERLSNEAKTKGFVTTTYGRRARFGYHDKHYRALNAVVQGSAADIFKVNLKAVYDERKTLGIHKLRQVVHDEFDGDRLPDEKYEKRIVDFLNEQRVQLRVPIIWNITSGANWKECH